jgi:glyoxylase-like metal-dependent hydrolase (beta-lactamase superfamily II)
MRKQNKGKFHFWSYIGTLGFGRHIKATGAKRFGTNLIFTRYYYKIMAIKIIVRGNKLKITRIELGAFNENCYILISTDTKEAIVIDPGTSSPEILRVLEGYNTRYILNTHGHFDHISGNNLVKTHTEAKLAIHEKDASMLTDPFHNFSQFFGFDPVTSVPADILIKEEGMIFKAGDIELKTIFLPGHSQGCTGFYSETENCIFSGDMMFPSTIGRVDAPGGSMEDMRDSIRKMLKLPDKTLVYPGHDEPFVLSDFKKVAPYFLNDE